MKSKISIKSRYGGTFYIEEESVRKIVGDITVVEIDDGMSFEIRSVAPIMDDAEYPGIRVSLDTTLLKLGADTKVKDVSGGMAIDYARKNEKLRNTEALRLLEKASL